MTAPKAGAALVAALLLGVACATAPVPAPPATRPARAQADSAVAMPDPFAAAVAEGVLRRGGHAVDAAVAAAFALAVTYPEAGNLGGGGFMLVFDDGAPAFLDYRETAPARATPDMYLDARGEVIDRASLVGALAVGVPGTVAGLEAAHRRYGRLAWKELLEPAIALARDGFVVPRQLAERVERVRPRFAGRTSFAEHFGSIEAGARFRQPELAATLERIAEHGAEELRTGETARALAEVLRRGGGLVTVDDLAAYRPIWRDPLVARWREYRVVGAPPPSSGGIAVIQLLRMRDLLAERFAGLAHNSPQYIHLVAEMEKRVFADRAEFLGDPDFVHVPTDALIDERHLAQRVAGVRADAISTVEDAQARIEALDTTHFSILDGEGNAVGNTYTLNASFGSGVVAAGFLLNDEMDDFAIKPGVPNLYGVVGGAANAIAPGKRMLSSMAPTFLLRDGRIALVVGTPGGSTILTTVYQTIVDIVDFGMSPAEAVAATRFHHQLLPPDEITYSPCCPLPDATLDALRRLGYRPQPHGSEFGDVQAIWIDAQGRLSAASDPRGRGVSRVLPRR